MTVSTDQTFRVWNARTGADEAVYRGQEPAVNAVVLRAGADQAFTAAADGSIRAWNIGEAARAGELWRVGPVVWGFTFSARGASA